MWSARLAFMLLHFPWIQVPRDTRALWNPVAEPRAVSWRHEHIRCYNCCKMNLIWALKLSQTFNVPQESVFYSVSVKQVRNVSSEGFPESSFRGDSLICVHQHWLTCLKWLEQHVRSVSGQKTQRLWRQWVRFFFRKQKPELFLDYTILEFEHWDVLACLLDLVGWRIVPTSVQPLCGGSVLLGGGPWPLGPDRCSRASYRAVGPGAGWCAGTGRASEACSTPPIAPPAVTSAR